MGNLNGLSIFEQISPVNNELDVIYTPDSSISKYSYEIIKDEESYGKYEVTDNKPSNIRLSETGKYKILITAYDFNNNVSNIESGIYNIDVDRPVIVIKDEVTIGLDEINNYKNTEEIDKYIKEKNLRVIDDNDYEITSNLSDITLDNIGNYKLTYTVSDIAGNIATKDINLNVVKTTENHLGFYQYGVIILGIVFILALIRNRRSIMFQSRISKYSVNPMKDTSLSLIDKIMEIYHSMVRKLSEYIEKSVFLEKYSKKYEKYIVLYRPTYDKGIHFVANKLLIGILFTAIALITKIVQFESLNFYEIIIIFVFGFFVSDIMYFSKYKIYRKKLENDIFQAVIIMNNAFKSGRSISQAIELVSTELDGQVALEFEKMSLELSYGLGIDVVFKRLADRINIEEVNYLTASLSILNRTGGNIIKVFSSIEKTMFNKQKLNLELKSLTGSSKIIAYALFVVPLLFIIFISIIDPTYFEAFYTTDIGMIFMIFIIVMYIAYIVCIRKIMKVRMWLDETWIIIKTISW